MNSYFPKTTIQNKSKHYPHTLNYDADK